MYTPAISEPLALAVTSRTPTRVSTALRRRSTASMRWPIRYSNVRIADRVPLARAPSWLAAHHRVGERALRRPETALNRLPARSLAGERPLEGSGPGVKNAHGDWVSKRGPLPRRGSDPRLSSARHKEAARRSRPSSSGPPWPARRSAVVTRTLVVRLRRSVSAFRRWTVHLPQGAGRSRSGRRPFTVSAIEIAIADDKPIGFISLH